MSDTPRTDALCRAQKSGWDDLVDASQDYVRLLDFARQLERELETMRLVAQQNGEDLDECREQKAALSATTPSQKEMVERFLSWPLPASVASDGCVTDPKYPHHRVGTNLLTADEAAQMIAYLFDRRRINGFRNPERRDVGTRHCREHGGWRHKSNCEICNLLRPTEKRKV